jgi:hypothetical protein
MSVRENIQVVFFFFDQVNIQVVDLLYCSQFRDFFLKSTCV